MALDIENIIYLFSKQVTLMRRPIVLSFPIQLVLPASTLVSCFSQWWNIPQESSYSQGKLLALPQEYGHSIMAEHEFTAVKSFTVESTE